MIIAFSGTDGAGKSTQISALRERLAQRHNKTHYIWARGGYTPLFSAMKRVVLVLIGRRGGKLMDPSNSVEYGKRRSGAFHKLWIARSWLILAMLDLALLYGLHTRVLSRMGRVVILDRYLIDTEIDFLRHHANVFSDRSLLWRLLSRLCPTPDVHFLVTVPVDVTMSRSLQKNEPYPDTRETLEFRLSAYEAFADAAKDCIVRLDGREPLPLLFQKIDQQIPAFSRP